MRALTCVGPESRSRIRRWSGYMPYVFSISVFIARASRATSLTVTSGGHAYSANCGPTSYVIDYKEPFRSDPGLSNPQDFRRAEFVSNSSYLNIHIFRCRLQIT